MIEKIPNFLSFPERTTSLFYSYKQDKHMDITHYIFKFMNEHMDIIPLSSCVHLYFVITGAHTLLGPQIVLYR